MSRRLKRTLVIYAVGAVLITLSSFLYFYFRSNLLFIALILLTFLISYLMPIWFRLFLKARSYEGEYKRQLFTYAKKHGVNLKNLYSIDSKRSNACAFSFGNNKTVCFNTNTLKNHPWDEIEGVMAHELGHHANKDIYVYSSIIAIILITTSWLNVLIFSTLHQNPINLLIICLVISAILLPVVLGISRWREGLADKYAKKMLDEPTKFGRFLERMITYEEKAGEKISKNPDIFSKIFFTHPWVYNRIALMKSS